ncbi:MAG: terpene cyclase/mutase family protein, partial [Gemmataceae bacterium]|nr:terpene cyclase/mutase family protein [Gemmataceae bacterium]
ASSRRRSMVDLRAGGRSDRIRGMILNAILLLAADPSPGEAVAGAERFFKRTARANGSFRPGTDPAYRGMSDSAASDLAPTAYAVVLSRTFGWKLPHEERTRKFLLSRQGKDGAFVNVGGTYDPESPDARAYNTTMGLMALRALGAKPERDPLPVFAAVLEEDYKKLPMYMTSFFPLAYLCAGEAIPADADRKIKALMAQDEDGYIHGHVASTFHAAHYYRLVGEKTPKAGRMVARVLRDQRRDGSWMLNMPSRDRHATFDACFVLRQLGKGPEVEKALARAAGWALSCRNEDGGFGHFPGSPSDADACYFQMGTLVQAGWLAPAKTAPKDGRLLGWGHLFQKP